MTLIITELNEFGIAMVADTAVAFEEQVSSDTTITRVLSGARKLQIIPYLNAGISWWGLAELPGPVDRISTDVWIFDFIRRHGGLESIDEFANELAQALQQAVGNVKCPLGFHLGGYVEQTGKKLATFYHVRNVDGPYLNYTFHEFRPGQDVHPRAIVTKKDRHRTRNGDFGPYAVLSQAVEMVLPNIEKLKGISIPHPSLQGRITYLVAWVKFVSALYASSEMLPTIGGTVLSLAITPEGQVNMETF